MIKSKSLNIVNDGELCYLTFPKLHATGLVADCFTTRLGGISTGYLSSMNMSFSEDRGDNPENVIENYRRICRSIGVDYKKCVFSHQTHTTNLRIITEQDIGKGITKPRDYDNVDGMITDLHGVTLVTQYADCVPLLFLDPVKKIIAASHSGWKGTANEIGRITVERMQSEFGCDPHNIIAAIGPSIGKCCFEIDDPVYIPFSKIPGINIDDICTYCHNGKYYIDLWKTNRLILEKAGIKPENIDVTDLCTKCNSDIFFSHRTMGSKRGNLAAMICLK